MGDVLKFEGTTKEAANNYNNDEKLKTLTDVLNDVVKKLDDTGVVSSGQIILFCKTDKTEGFVSARLGLNSLESQVLFLSDYMSNNVQSMLASQAEKLSEEHKDGE